MSLSRSAGLFNLAAFNRIVFSAVLAGILAGLLLTGVQQLQVSKIILQAEVYEDAADAAKEAAAARQAAPHARRAHGEPGHDHLHDHAAMAAEPGHAGHEQAGETHAGDAHEHTGWQPANGAERIFFTVVANVSIAASYGLVLCAIYCMSGLSAGWRVGMLWGLAGYAVFFLAPSLGLPPEVPGTAAAPLHDRQLWWVLTAALTAGGLGLLCFARGWPLKALGLVLLAAPHMVGAPQPEVHGSAAPEELARAFIYATAMANAAFWLALGALTGFFYKKFA